MSLGAIQSKIYLNIKEGKVFNKENPFEYVEGYLRGIEIKDRDFRGEVIKYWYINLESQSGELYSLALSYNSGVAKSLFNSLASSTDFSKEVRIKPYLSGAFTKVVTYLGGDKLSWKYPELPNVEEVKVGDKTVKNDSKRMEFIVNLVKEINRVI
jgi:hypothetical protein